MMSPEDRGEGASSSHLDPDEACVFHHMVDGTQKKESTYFSLEGCGSFELRVSLERYWTLN